MANIMTGVFASIPNITTIDAANYYNLDQVTMDHGTGEVKASLPEIIISGGQTQGIYTLQPTQFTGGQDEINSEIPQMTMGSGIQGVAYDDFTFTQTSLSGGVLDIYNSLDLEVISDGVNEEKTDFNGGNDIVMTGGSVATQAMSDGNLQGPTNIDFSQSISYTIDGESNSGTYASLSVLLAEFSATKSNYDLSTHSTDLFIGTATNAGELAQNIVVPISISYTDLTTGPQTFTDSVTITGGQDEELSSTTIPVTVGFSEFGEDRTLTIGAANSVFVSDAAKSEQSASEVATLIAADLNTAYPDYTIVANGADIEFTSNVVTDVTIPVSGSDYSIQTSKAQKLSVEVSGDYIGGTQNSNLQLDEETFDLGSSPMSASSILTLLESREYSTFEDDINNGKLLLTARTKGDRSAEQSPIIDGSFSSQLGVKASTSFTISESLSVNAIDKTVEVLGQTVTLGTTGNTQSDIAYDIATALSSHPNYDVTSSGTTVNIVAKNYGVDTTEVFGTDNNYTTVDEVLGESNSVTIPAGIQMGSSSDQTVTINSHDLTIPNTSDLTAEQVATKLAELYNIADTNLNGYTAYASATDIKLVQKVGADDTSTTFVTDGLYNSQDKKSATLTIEIPDTKSLPNDPDESLLTIDSNTFDLKLSQNYIDNGILTNDEIGQFIADQTYTSYTSTYDDLTNTLTFTTNLEDEDANNLNLATNADLTYVTQNDIWAQTSLTITDSYSGASADNEVSNDAILIIGGVTINLGNTFLDKIGIAQVIETALNSDNSFTSIYNLQRVDETITIKKNVAELVTTEVLNPEVLDAVTNLPLGAKDYTNVLELKATGNLKITEQIVADAVDKQVVIAGTSIDFTNADNTKQLMAQKIVNSITNDVNQVITRAEIDPSDDTNILFNSLESGTSGNHDIVTNIQYNGRAQTSTLSFGSLEEGFTYDITINQNTYSDIVTPTNTQDLISLIETKLANDPAATVSSSGNDIILTSPVEQSFTVQVNGASNSAPTTTSVTVSGLAQSGQDLTCDYTYVDAESDLEDVSTFKWYSDGVEISGANSNTFTLTNLQANTNVKCEVTPVADYGVKIGLPIQSDEILTAYDVITLSNNELFSVPYGVDYQRMLSEVSNLELGDDIKEFTGGGWNSIEQDAQGNHMLMPLHGYKFTSSDSQKTISLPVYIDNEYEIQNIVRELDTNFNLVGLNSIYQKSTTEFLHNFNDFNAIYDENGNLVFDGIGNPVSLDPTKAYWMSVSGNTGETKVFYGVPSGLNN